MKIAFDLDGTLTDTWTEQVYNEEVIYHNENYSYVDFWLHRFNSFPVLKQEFYRKIPFLYTRKAISKKDKEVLNRLGREHEIFYITCRPKDVETATSIWLEKQGVPNPENLFFSSTKKVSEIRACEIDYLLDDMLVYAQAVKDFCQVVLIKKFWNDVPERNHFLSVNTLLDFERLIC